MEGMRRHECVDAWVDLGLRKNVSALLVAARINKWARHVKKKK